ncbi:hypothetical protein EG68_08884 [Paragonimus skrjabini miyazakii]|uniref:Uncharacterized protein n=1 Tax=Paragonimus skrjabini miyazakii TaxID=59628 RepID=A0A8S9YTW6_9TREM|nr:hypothetical protein EG68_08884 [Paragonimus skrjabini miyazakii]
MSLSTVVILIILSFLPSSMVVAYVLDQLPNSECQPMTADNVPTISSTNTKKVKHFRTWIIIYVFCNSLLLSSFKSLCGIVQTYHKPLIFVFKTQSERPSSQNVTSIGYVNWL